MASVYLGNRFSGERRLLIDGLTLEQAQQFAEDLRARYSPPEQLGDGIWQGFDVTIEPDAFDAEEDVATAHVYRVPCPDCGDQHSVFVDGPLPPAVVEFGLRCVDCRDAGEG